MTPRQAAQRAAEDGRPILHHFALKMRNQRRLPHS